MSTGVEKHSKFNEIMLPYSDMLYNYGFYLTGSVDDASDLLQETFLKAYRFFDKFEQGTNAKAWLYRIMRNTFINEYRRVKRQPEIVEYDEQISPYQFMQHDTQYSNDLRDRVEHHVLGDEVSGAIAALPEKFKSVIVLRDLEDLPYEEIAEVLDIPIGTVRSRLHRARSILYNNLKEYAKNTGYETGESFNPAEFALAV
ncbi:MAG: sigma-70 family RNA polymerase sigma factor [Bacteroidetes bacterium]|nr:sigma-70 family RNA polymerase sigma factor [Bacteroidota bacterium]MCW5896451.1 sigma-70 family RNA polymerase sigma factor [Bacteroidota bacterium]